jgi:hypothetical protein
MTTDQLAPITSFSDDDIQRLEKYLHKRISTSNLVNKGVAAHIPIIKDDGRYLIRFEHY